MHHGICTAHSVDHSILGKCYLHRHTRRVHAFVPVLSSGSLLPCTFPCNMPNMSSDDSMDRDRRRPVDVRCSHRWWHCVTAAYLPYKRFVCYYETESQESGPCRILAFVSMRLRLWSTMFTYSVTAACLQLGRDTTAVVWADATLGNRRQLQMEHVWCWSGVQRSRSSQNVQFPMAFNQCCQHM